MRPTGRRPRASRSHEASRDSASGVRTATTSCTRWPRPTVRRFPQAGQRRRRRGADPGDRRQYAVFPDDWSRDGRRLVYVVVSEGASTYGRWMSSGRTPNRCCARRPTKCSRVCRRTAAGWRTRPTKPGRGRCTSAALVRHKASGSSRAAAACSRCGEETAVSCITSDRDAERSEHHRRRHAAGRAPQPLFQRRSPMCWRRSAPPTPCRRTASASC